MRKPILFFLLLLALAITAYGLWSARDSTLSRKESRFGFDQDAPVDRILISSPSKELIVEKEATWKIDQKEADPKQVQDLLFLASRVHTLSPVAGSMQETIAEQCDRGLSIEFRAGKKRLSSYTLCRYEKQLYARKEGAKHAFRIAVKGYPNVDLYSLLDPNSGRWVSKYLLDYSPEEIQNVTISYPKAPEKGFSISLEEGQQVKLYDHRGMDRTDLADPEKIQDYLHFFSGIPHAGKTDPPGPVRDDLKIFDLVLVSRQNISTNLSGYLRILPDTHKPDPALFFAYNPVSGFFTVKYTEFDPILVPADYFLKK